MSRRPLAILVLGILAALSLSAQEFSLSPSSGPTAGGTEVTITGELDGGPYFVTFGGAPATDVRRVDAHTLVAVTPEHLPGKVAVEIIAPPQFLLTGLTFTYTGDPPASYARLLLPIFVDPVAGQFGSVFVTAFSAELRQGERARLFGLDFACRFFCPPDFFGDAPIAVNQMFRRLDGADLVRSGNPGRFVFIPREELENVAMSLRVYDRSRPTKNFGTEIPIVRENRFVQGPSAIKLLDVPTDENFRNTLRIYGTGPSVVTVRVETPATAPVDFEIALAEGKNVFQPAFATFTTFPTGIGPATVTVLVPPGTPSADPRIWAFVSVTNNDTQLITTVSPQP